MKKLNKKEAFIKIEKITENEDGSASIDFSYEEEFTDLVKKHLKLKSEPTDKQIQDFVLKAIENSVEDYDKE